MAVHSAWPPLACLAMFVMVIAFIILKYGDRICHARTAPIARDFDDTASTINTESCLYEKDSMRDFEEVGMEDIIPDDPMPEVHKLEKYEYAV